MPDRYVIQVVGITTGQPTGFDGQYLAEYDPGRNGRDPLSGYPMMAHVVTTPDPSRAMTFGSAAEAHGCWTRVDPREPVRPDGRPNRPLTAFTIAVEKTHA